jgi:hypothetical protein
VIRGRLRGACAPKNRDGDRSCHRSTCTTTTKGAPLRASTGTK